MAFACKVVVARTRPEAGSACQLQDSLGRVFVQLRCAEGAPKDAHQQQRAQHLTVDFGEVAWQRIWVLGIPEVDAIIILSDGGVCRVIRRRGEGRRGRSRQAARRIGHVMFQVGAPAERGSRLRGVECGAGHHDACFRGALLTQGSCRTDGDAVVLAVDGRILTARAPVTGIRGEEEDMLKSRWGERRDGGADESVLTVEPVRPRPLGRS